MKRAFRLPFALLLVALISAGGCRSGNNETAVTQERFGVRMAKMNLWREALFRFRRAVQMNPGDALAHNNLAVAYEANGDFENALKEYREAIRLDKSNQYIQKNYSRFVEFTSRNKKRQQRGTPAPKAASSTNTTPIPPGAGAAPASQPGPAVPIDAPGVSAPGSVMSPAPPSTAPATPPPAPQPKPPGGQS